MLPVENEGKILEKMLVQAVVLLGEVVLEGLVEGGRTVLLSLRPGVVEANHSLSLVAAQRQV